MNWEAIGAIGEIIGALAVVISIVYLAIQIRANTRATKASASFDATHSWAVSNELATSLDDNLVLAAVRSYRVEFDQDDLSEVESVRLAIFHRSLFQKLEGQYFLFKFGYLDPKIWEKRSRWAAGLVRLPFWQRWWEVEKQESVYTDEFIAAIESAASISVSMSGSQSR